ncbi:MAG: nucleotidyltransferase family protein [Draconibacterium sp.]|nr:nucleotidyltransferase family protein [Draconibacterium sp.]
MNNKELLYFIGKCLTADKYPENLLSVKNQIAKNDIDWEKFVSICSSHLITPVIYLKFKKAEILNLLPDDLANYLQEIYELSLSRNQMILEQLKEVCDLLAKNNIIPTLLKGAGNLIDNLYSDLGERIMGDIDLLVTEDEYLKAAKIMLNEDYTESKLFYYDDVKLLKHYPRLSHPDKVASVEIHRIPVDEDYLSLFNHEMISKGLKKVDGFCFVLSDKHKLILNFIHSQLTNKSHKSALLSLRDVYDLYLLSEKVNVAELLKEINPRKIASGYFYLSQKMLGVNIGYTSKPTFSDKWLHYKHDLNFSSKAFYSANKYATEIYDRIIIRYFGLIGKSLYSKKTRSFIVMRMSKPEWYRSQWRSWKNTFKLKN